MTSQTKVGDDPFMSKYPTIEFLLPSPPAFHSFEELPQVKFTKEELKSVSADSLPKRNNIGIAVGEGLVPSTFS